MSYLTVGLAIMWVIILGYMIRINHEQKKVNKQLEEIKGYTK